MYPVLLTIGPFNVYAFGFFLAVSFLLSTFIIWKFGKEELKEEEYLDAYLYTSIAALISARFVYIAFHFNEFGLNLLRYIVVRETPGLSFLGGLLGAFLFLWWYCKKKRYDFIHLVDLFSLTASFALGLAKIGEQMGGAGFGKTTDLFFGVNIVGRVGKRFPTEIFEAMIFLTLFIVLVFIYGNIRRKKWPEGLAFLLFIQVFAWTVFLLEFLKEYKVYIYNLSFRQFAALGMIIITIYPLLKKTQIVKIIKTFVKRKEKL